MTMKKRFASHSIFNDVVRSDWIKAIELSPDNYQALLYIPKQTDSKLDDENNKFYEAEVINELDPNQDDLIYNVPIVVSVLDCPDENEFFLTSNSNSENIGEADTPLLLRIAHDPVPVGSILEWEEETSPNTTRRCWWYVHSSQGFGTSNIGSIYICIPARNFDERAMEAESLITSLNFGFEPPAESNHYE
ncbi:hypothetical protein VXS06_14495 [Photobacterium toruni]|uniref:Uncharacterized protein n=1 Tax=Photobacterium toruni TaxID=1935446 RepID=A0ABU6L8R5_9GAMM|nr:hypothetical protein [Photobacterium toruni]